MTMLVLHARRSKHRTTASNMSPDDAHQATWTILATFAFAMVHITHLTASQQLHTISLTHANFRPGQTLPSKAVEGLKHCYLDQYEHVHTRRCMLRQTPCAGLDGPPPSEVVEGLRNPYLDQYVPPRRRQASESYQAYNPMKLHFVSHGITDLRLPEGNVLQETLDDVSQRLENGVHAVSHR